MTNGASGAILSARSSFADSTGLLKHGLQCGGFSACGTCFLGPLGCLVSRCRSCLYSLPSLYGCLLGCLRRCFSSFLGCGACSLIRLGCYSRFFFSVLAFSRCLLSCFVGFLSYLFSFGSCFASGSGSVLDNFTPSSTA